MNQLSLSEITDINTLKALAYDTLIEQQRTNHNLQLIERRIAEVRKESEEPTITEPEEDPPNKPKSATKTT